MKIKELLLKIEQLARENKIHKPYLVGGFPRDKVLGLPVTTSDFDITTGHPDCVRLARIVASDLIETFPSLSYQEAKDGHIDMNIGGKDLDFSSNVIHPYIKNLMARVGIKNPSSLQLEMMSRDFTCNTLLMTMDLKKVSDPTGMAIKDIKRKLVRTVIPPGYSFRDDPKRIIRAIYMAAKLEFRIEPAIIKWVNRNPQYLELVSDNYLKIKLTKSFEKNPKITAKYMDEMNIWKNIPMIKELLPYAKGRL